LSGNPIRTNAENAVEYTNRIVFRLQQISTLDGERVTAKDKVGACNFYGQDLEQRKENFAKFYSGEEFPAVVDPYEDLEFVQTSVVPTIAVHAAESAIYEGTEAAKTNLKYFAKIFVTSVIQGVLKN